MARRKTSDAVEILGGLVGEDVSLRALIEEERVHVQVAQEMLELRAARGLTQKELARRVGTTQSVIARLENADYRGHSLRMLRRIAEALNARLDVGFVTDEVSAQREPRRPRRA